jgi:hypothetical protein
MKWKINGDFSCSNNPNLKSLIGYPNEVKGYFICSHNPKLTSLEGCPKEVKGFSCSFNNLVSLEGCPEIVKGDFNCSGNHLESLEGCPDIVTGDFDCSGNNLRDLTYSPEIITNCFIFDNFIPSLDGISIYNLKQNIKSSWFKDMNSKIQEEWFDKYLENNPDLINYINFETTKDFKDKWEHLFNANKFDLI